MRDIKRIDRILEKIGIIWKEHPDERFGQMLINMGLISDDFDTWNVEDDVIEESLETNIKVIKKLKTKSKKAKKK